MSYSIYIGEAVPAGGEELGVEHIELPDAPTFRNDQLTGSSNSRHPGYAQWYSFVRDVGLDDLFFNNLTGIMREYPGTFAVQMQHLRQVNDAHANWKRQHPYATPGFGDGYDNCLARLIWLEWWISWALDNCKVPVIHNH